LIPLIMLWRLVQGFIVSILLPEVYLLIRRSHLSQSGRRKVSILPPEVYLLIRRSLYSLILLGLFVVFRTSPRFAQVSGFFDWITSVQKVWDPFIFADFGVSEQPLGLFRSFRCSQMPAKIFHILSSIISNPFCCLQYSLVTS
jgi:hypothetical protein